MSGGRPALLLLLLTACARLRSGAPAPTAAESEPVRLLHTADGQSPADARQIYRTVVQRFPDTPAAAEALYQLGCLYADPDGPLHDWHAADTAFRRLATEHPDDPHAAEARAWHAALTALLREEAENERLRSSLDRLKALDLEQERGR
jgi:hypothetical protein